MLPTVQGAGDGNNQRLIIESSSYSDVTTTSNPAAATGRRSRRSSSSAATGSGASPAPARSKAVLIGCTVGAAMLLVTLCGVLVWGVPAQLHQKAAAAAAAAGAAPGAYGDRIIPLPTQAGGAAGRLDASYCATLTDRYVKAACEDYLITPGGERFRAAEAWAQVDFASCEFSLFPGDARRARWTRQPYLACIAAAALCMAVTVLIASTEGGQSCSLLTHQCNAESPPRRSRTLNPLPPQTSAPASTPSASTPTSSPTATAASAARAPTAPAPRRRASTRPPRPPPRPRSPPAPRAPTSPSSTSTSLTPSRSTASP
jgi:hypothetical protein